MQIKFTFNAWQRASGICCRRLRLWLAYPRTTSFRCVPYVPYVACVALDGNPTQLSDWTPGCARHRDTVTMGRSVIVTYVNCQGLQIHSRHSCSLLLHWLTINERIKYNNTTLLLRQLHWLSVRQRITYKLAVLTFKTRRTSTPVYLSRLITARDGLWPHFALLYSSTAIRAVPQDCVLRTSFPLHCTYHLELSAEHCDSCWLTDIFQIWAKNPPV